MRNVAALLVLVSACAGDGTAASDTGAPGSSTSVDSSTGDVWPGGSSSGADTTAAITGTTAATAAEDSGPPISFDMGVVVDAPGGDDCTDAIDVVFVMDVSTSMGPFLSTLADEILAVDAAIAALGPGVVPRYGLVVFVDDVLVVNDGQAYDDVDTLAADFDTWSAFTSGNDQLGGVGYNTTFPENSIDALYAAAGDFEWRPIASTTRIVIHTTDDTFWEAPSVAEGVIPIQHTYAEAVDELQSQEVRVFSFAAMLGGPAETDDVSMGWFGPYMDQTAIPVATDGGVFSIEDVLTGMVSLGDAIVGAVENSHCDPYDPVG